METINLDTLSVKAAQDRQRAWDLRFLRMIKNEISTWSKDPSTKCGAVIVRDINKFVSLGYNGYPAGVPDDDSLHNRELKYAKIIHAEKNAILFAQKDVTGMTLYVWPLPPCASCASFIIQSGITRVVSVTPEDEERKMRWLSSNEIALMDFLKASVEVKLYGEGEIG